MPHAAEILGGLSARANQATGLGSTRERPRMKMQWPG